MENGSHDGDVHGYDAGMMRVHVLANHSSGRLGCRGRVGTSEHSSSVPLGRSSSFPQALAHACSLRRLRRHPLCGCLHCTNARHRQRLTHWQDIATVESLQGVATAESRAQHGTILSPPFCQSQQTEQMHLPTCTRTRAHAPPHSRATQRVRRTRKPQRPELAGAMEDVRG